MQWIAEIPHRDFARLVREGEVYRLEARGCLAFLRKVNEVRKLLQGPGADLEQVFAQISWGLEHQDLLIKELLLRALGRWQPVYDKAQLCHCRVVSTEMVIGAIYSGAHNVEEIGRRCSAGTSCGTCQPHSQALLEQLLSQ